MGGLLLFLHRPKDGSMTDHNLRLPVLLSDDFIHPSVWEIVDDRFTLPNKAKKGDALGVSIPVLFDESPLLLPITNVLTMGHRDVAEEYPFTMLDEEKQELYGTAIVRIQSAFEGLFSMEKLAKSMVSNDNDADWFALHIIRGAALFTFEHHVGEIFQGRYHDAPETVQEHLDEAMCMIVPPPQSNHDRINWASAKTACADIFCMMMPFPDAKSGEWTIPIRPDFQTLHP
jgi:hypothetical protein